MTRLIARCPGCQSTFYVTLAQGRAANNLVRCGRCGHLFSVNDHLVDLFPETPKGEGPAIPEQLASANKVEAAARPEIPRSELVMMVEEEYLAPDFSGIDAVGEGLFEYDPSTAQSDIVLGAPDSDSEAESKIGFDVAPQEVPEIAPEVNRAAFLGLKVSKPDSAKSLDLSALTALSADFEWEPARAKAFDRGFRLSLNAFIIVLGLAGLAGQYVYFNVATLSQRVEFRPWLQVFCSALPCEVPAYENRQLIRVDRLVVQSHPDVVGGLLVELILSNSASYGQAYPPLILRFNDLSGERVAIRRLLPREYLPQSIASTAAMPVDKSVSIKLAILDPGGEAVSYSVSIAQ